MSITLLGDPRGDGDSLGTEAAFVAAALAWGADPEDSGKKAAMVSALADDLTPAFAVSGNFVVYHGTDGLDHAWVTPASSEIADYATAALNGWLAGHAVEGS